MKNSKNREDSNRDIREKNTHNVLNRNSQSKVSGRQWNTPNQTARRKRSEIFQIITKGKNKIASEHAIYDMMVKKKKQQVD